MGDRGPSKRITMADFLRAQEPRPPPSTSASNTAVSTATSAAAGSNNDTARNINNDDSTKQSLPYKVRATKKGGVPCVVESRKHHKVVVLSNIEGDVSALLSALQKSLGTGGVTKGKSVEIQGEHHLEKVKKFCLKSDCVVGATKQSKAEAVADSSKKSKSNSKNTASEAPKKPSVNGTGPLSQKQIKTMKPPELKEHLAARQLSTQGNKKELLARLAAAV